MTTPLQLGELIFRLDFHHHLLHPHPKSGVLVQVTTCATNQINGKRIASFSSFLWVESIAPRAQFLPRLELLQGRKQ